MPSRVDIVKGFQDVLPPESGKWSRVFSAAGGVFPRFGYREVYLPVLEEAELFARGIGSGTDIVDKEMYTFADRKGKMLSLRPEGTASAVRAYLSSGRGKGEAVKWYYIGPMFRYERPQKGRYRQFYQIGAEAMGYAGPGTDAEVLLMLDRFFGELGVGGLRLELNSLGCPRCRPAYREELVKYLGGVEDKLCGNCRGRLTRNPLRVLDCKEERCQAAVRASPEMTAFLCPACREHFSGLRRDLDLLGLPYAINPRIVRGLDYYTRTVFEYLAPSGLGAQNAVAAGGRYDGLMEELGGPPTPAIGFALGVERLTLLLPEAVESGPELFIVTLGEEARAAGLRLMAELRDHGLWVEMLTDAGDRSLKSQLKAAQKAGAGKALILGEKELREGRYSVKDMETGEQKEAEKKELIENLRGGKIRPGGN